MTANPPEPFRPVPPLTLSRHGDITSALVGEIGDALGDLGFTEQDLEIEIAIAEALVGLDLDR